MPPTLDMPPVTGRYACLKLCPRAGGVCVDLNFNPACDCNFDCIYCSVDRRRAVPCGRIDPDALAEELARALAGVTERCEPEPGEPRSFPLRLVAISGDGEPTLCPQFAEAVEAVMHLRALQRFPFFKIALLTNGSGLDRPEVERALQLFCADDEVWVKLDAGGQEWMSIVNRPSDLTLDQITAKLLRFARRRPIIVQTLFPSVHGRGPDDAEIQRYIFRLRSLVNDGACIAGVQIYSASSPTADAACGHLPLRTLSHIARVVREATGLKVEVF
ncbi:MAG: hypothetical protein HY301_07700 [Verrucomicrobia bacterium]|nr:hypothetical protein [Verrucomicrobiota bacterium]